MQKIIVYMPNWLGDVIMALPVLKKIQKNFPDSLITVYTQKKYVEIYKNEGFKNLICFDRKNSIKNIFKIRKQKFDTGILFVNSFSSALFFFLCNIKKRIGYKKEARDFLLSESFKIDTDLHQADRFMYLINKDMDEKKDFQLNILESKQKKAYDFIKKQNMYLDKKIIGLGIGSAYGDAKEWGIQNYIKLAEKLVNEYDYLIMLLGSPNERKGAERFINELGTKNIINAVGNTNIIQAVYLISICHTFIGNDSGLVHVSASLDVPTITIFGSTSPAKTAPQSNNDCVKIIKTDIACSPCFLRICPNKTKKCMNNITVDDVFSFLKESKIK